LLTSTKAWQQRGGGRFSWRSAVAITPWCRLAQRAAAAPNTYSDSGGTRTEVRGGCAQAGSPGRSRCEFVPASPAIQGDWLIHRSGCPVSGSSGAGQTPGSVPGGAGGGGACERDTQVSQLVESPALPCGLWDRSCDLSLFPRTPVHPRRRVFTSADHVGVLLLQGDFCLLTSRGRAGSASHPSDWLPAIRPPTHSADSRSICDNALSCGLARMAPVRLRLADPPVSQCRTKRSTSNTFFVRSK
jgi:hypothetical protein